MSATTNDRSKAERQPAFWHRAAESQPAQRLLVLVHGWTGDEHSMTIFANKLSPAFWLYSPRGPIETGSSGFGWVTGADPSTAGYAEYQLAARHLYAQLEEWIEQNRLGHLPLGAAGFSQGAAVAYTLALEFPQKFSRVAGLAGYLPQGFAESDAVYRGALSGKQVFIAHGRKDTIVPVGRAREAARVFEQAGAQVEYCEDDNAHKLSLRCFKAMGQFFAEP